MQTDIEKFYNSVAQNPALLNKLTSNAATPDEFIDHAIKEASAQGFSITHDEARTWIDSQIAASQNGELTDVQLESVAGGKPGIDGPRVISCNGLGRSFKEFLLTDLSLGLPARLAVK